MNGSQCSIVFKRQFSVESPGLGFIKLIHWFPVPLWYWLNHLTLLSFSSPLRPLSFLSPLLLLSSPSPSSFSSYIFFPSSFYFPRNDAVYWEGFVGEDAKMLGGVAATVAGWTLPPGHCPSVRFGQSVSSKVGKVGESQDRMGTVWAFKGWEKSNACQK